MRFTTVFSFGIIGLAAAETFVPSLQSFQGVNFIPVFFDSFSGFPGTLPADYTWLFDVGTGYPNNYYSQWGNNEQQIYTNSDSNIHITAEQNLAIIPTLENGIWKSARIETHQSFSCEPGKMMLIEAKIKLGDAPEWQQQGIWPAFWALGASFRDVYANWPRSTEWDILEVWNGSGLMYGTAHCGTDPAGPCNEKVGVQSEGKSFTMGQWHTLSFVVDRSLAGGEDWRQESLAWYLDGEKIHTVTGESIGDESTWDLLAHQGHFLLLNVAVGGSLPGPTNANTVDGSRVGMEVDYVGVWNSA